MHRHSHSMSFEWTLPPTTSHISSSETLFASWGNSINFATSWRKTLMLWILHYLSFNLFGGLPRLLVILQFLSPNCSRFCTYRGCSPFRMLPMTLFSRPTAINGTYGWKIGLAKGKWSWTCQLSRRSLDDAVEKTWETDVGHVWYWMLPFHTIRFTWQFPSRRQLSVSNAEVYTLDICRNGLMVFAGRSISFLKERSVALPYCKLVWSLVFPFFFHILDHISCCAQYQDEEVKAAITVQRHYRSYQARKAVKGKRLQIFLGLGVDSGWRCLQSEHGWQNSRRHILFCFLLNSCGNLQDQLQVQLVFNSNLHMCALHFLPQTLKVSLFPTQLLFHVWFLFQDQLAFMPNYFLNLFSTSWFFQNKFQLALNNFMLPDFQKCSAFKVAGYRMQWYKRECVLVDQIVLAFCMQSNICISVYRYL